MHLAYNHMRTNQDNYTGLIKAAKRGRLMQVVGYGSGQIVLDQRWSGLTIRDLAGPELAQIVWRRPNFDFGYLLDRGHGDWIGEAAYESLLGVGLEHLSGKNELLLPFSRCAFLFRFQEDSGDYDRTYCALLDQDSSGIRGMSFIRQDADIGNLARNWTKECAEFRLDEHGVASLNFDASKPDVAEMIERSFRQLIDDVVVASLLLAQRKEATATKQPSTLHRRIGSECGKASSRPDAPIVVLVDRAKLTAIAAEKRDLATAGRAGHVRRAHIRVLWRGTDKQRNVKVRSSLVNGGGGGGIYVVK